MLIECWQLNVTSVARQCLGQENVMCDRTQVFVFPLVCCSWLVDVAHKEGASYITEPSLLPEKGGENGNFSSTTTIIIMPCCCRSAATFSESVVVPVPADVLWATVVDLPALPSVVSMVTDFEWVSTSSSTATSTGEPPFKVGARFREVRRHKNQDVVMYKTVTRLQDDSDDGSGERHLSFGIGLKDYSHVENTSTLIVQPFKPQPERGDDKEENSSSLSSSSSLLVLTVAFGWNSWMDYIVNNFLCRVCIESMIRHHMKEEVEDYRRAAIERYEHTKQTSDETKE